MHKKSNSVRANFTLTQVKNLHLSFIHIVFFYWILIYNQKVLRPIENVIMGLKICFVGHTWYMYLNRHHAVIWLYIIMRLSSLICHTCSLYKEQYILTWKEATQRDSIKVYVLCKNVSHRKLNIIRYITHVLRLKIMWLFSANTACI